MPLNYKSDVSHIEPKKGKLQESPAPDPQFPLQSIALTFNTTTDDKDNDTVVQVGVDNGSIAMGAGNVGGGSHWDNNTTNVVGLPVVNGVDYSAAANGHMNITIHPNGHDTWNFNVTLRMNFAGGGWRQASWSGISLAQDHPSVDLTWHP